MLRFVLRTLGTRTIRLDGDIITSDNGVVAAIYGLPVLALLALLLARRTRRHGTELRIHPMELAALSFALALGMAVGSAISGVVVGGIVAVYGAIGATLGWLWTKGGSHEEQRLPRRRRLAVLLAAVLTAGAGHVIASTMEMRSELTHEAPAVTTLMSVCHGAQVLHHRLHGTYAAVNELHKSRRAVPSLPGSPGGRHYKYGFIDMESRGGVKLDRANEFAICAVPRQYMATGQYTVIMDQTGVIHYKDNGGVEVRNFPAEPEADGWMRYGD